MYTIALAALIAATSVAPGTAAQHTFEPHGVTVSATAVDSPEQLIAKARAAEASGDFTTAHMEYMRAVRAQRADGILAVEASYGAAHVLTLQEKFRDAADVLEQLAADANLLGDADTEARVLLDVVSLKVGHHRRAAARADAQRLKELVTDERLTAETRRQIKARLS